MEGSLAPVYEIQKDNRSRFQAEVADDLTVGIKVLAETHERRVKFGVHAYAVLDIQTSKGVIRVRDIRIKRSKKNECFYVEWRRWFTGNFRGTDRDGKPRKELLDVAGPMTPTTRRNFNDCIVAVFEQIKSEAAAGTLGATKGGAKLASLRDQLVTATAAAEDARTDTDSDIKVDAVVSHAEHIDGTDPAVVDHTDGVAVGAEVAVELPLPAE